MALARLAMRRCQLVNNRLALALILLGCSSATADTLCFSPVAKKSGDISSDRPWWVRFDYRIQVDNGPVIKPSPEDSTPYDFSTDSPLVKIWLGDDIKESFRVTREALADGRYCIYFNNLYESWSIAEKWQVDKLCSCQDSQAKD